MRSVLSLSLAAMLAAGTVRADEVTDTLQSALESYEAGDVAYALEELAYAQQLMMAMKADGLAAFLPPAPDGWTMEINTEMNAAMAMMGGGTGAEGRYTNGSDSFTITLTADSPMVGMFAGMFGNAAMLAAGGAKTIRVGRERFMDQDGQLTGLIENRILVQANGASVDTMLPLIESMDFRELARFGN
jgi:hypothetical protein